jgi:nucleoside-diphosphate-sugar epimerase
MESARPVRAIVRPGSKRAAPAATEIRAVPLAIGPLTDAFEGAEVVVHLAGRIRSAAVGEFRRSNAEGTEAVARAARSANARLLYVSSLAAAGPAPPESPRGESDAPAPITAYGMSKLAGESAVRAIDGLRWTILRPGVVYGPQHGGLLVLFKAAQRGFVPLIGRQTAAYTFIHIDDMVAALEAAIATPADSRVIFVGHPVPVTTRGLVEGIRSATGRPAAIVPVPLALTRAAAALCDLTTKLTGRILPLDRWRYAELAAAGFVCRVDLMRELLQIEAKVPLGEGLARTAEAYRCEGWL